MTIGRGALYLLPATLDARQATEVTQDMTTPDENKQLVRKARNKLLNEQHFEAAGEFLAEDYVEHNPVLPGGTIRGRDEIVAFWKEFFDPWDDLSVAGEEFVAEDDHVAVRTRGGGTLDGEFMGVDATGRTIDITGMEMYRIEGGKIAEAWICVDSLGMMEQLGAVPG